MLILMAIVRLVNGKCPTVKSVISRLNVRPVKLRFISRPSIKPANGAKKMLVPNVSGARRMEPES